MDVAESTRSACTHALAVRNHRTIHTDTHTYIRTYTVCMYICTVYIHALLVSIVCTVHKCRERKQTKIVGEYLPSTSVFSLVHRTPTRHVQSTWSVQYICTYINTQMNNNHYRTELTVQMTAQDTRVARKPGYKYIM